MPFWYPGNNASFLNGTQVDPFTSNTSVIDNDLVYSINGYIAKNEYD